MFKDIMKYFRRNREQKTFSECVSFSMDTARKIYLTNITPQTVEQVKKTISWWNNIDIEDMVEVSKRAPIRMYINSTGGDFNAMLSLYDIIRLSKTPIYTFNIGTAYKEAFFIYLAGHKRFSYPHASFAYERDLRHIADEEENHPMKNFYEKQLSELKDILLERTKITDNEYNKHLKTIWYITADEAFKLGICNQIQHLGSSED